MFVAMLWMLAGLGFTLFSLRGISKLPDLQRMEMSLTGTVMFGVGLVLAQLELM